MLGEGGCLEDCSIRLPPLAPGKSFQEEYEVSVSACRSAGCALHVDLQAGLCIRRDLHRLEAGEPSLAGLSPLECSSMRALWLGHPVPGCACTSFAAKFLLVATLILCLQVIFCLDARERFSQSVGGRRLGVTEAVAHHLAMLQQRGIPVESRHLAVGDALWVARSRQGPPVCLSNPPA